MSDHPGTIHISLLVESSNEIQRQSGAGQAVRAALVRGKVLTPPAMAGTTVSMMILNFAGFDAAMQPPRAAAPGAEAIPPNTLLLCHNCLPHYDRVEDAMLPEVGDEPVDGNSLHGKTPAVSREGLNRWMATSAQWCGVAPGRQMLYGLSRVSVMPSEPPGTRARAHIDILETHNAERIATLDDLRDFFDFHMRGEIDGVEHNANSLIRLVSPDSGQIITLWVYSARRFIEQVGSDSRTRSFSIPDTAAATWKEAIVQGKQAKGLAQVVAVALGATDVGDLRPEHRKLAADLRGDVVNGKILIEAIPGQRIRIIGDSLLQLVNPKAYPDSPLVEYAERCWTREKGKRVQGFVPMHANVLVSQPMARDVNQLATVVAAKFIPDPDSVVYSVQELVTPNYSPKARASAPGP